MMDDAAPRPRINVGMFGSNQGKYVTIVGRAHDPDKSGMAFRLTSSDNQEIAVRLQEPLQDYVNGVVQVQGLCDGKSLVNSTYIHFPEDKKPFDMEQYNQAVLYLSQFKELVMPEIPTSS